MDRKLPEGYPARYVESLTRALSGPEGEAVEALLGMSLDLEVAIDREARRTEEARHEAATLRSLIIEAMRLP